MHLHSYKFLSQQEACDVELMNGASERNSLGGEVMWRRRDPMNAMHKDGATELAIDHGRLHFAVASVKASHEANLHQTLPPADLGRDDAPALCGRGGKWFLTEDRLAKSDAFKDEVIMGLVR